MYKINTYNLLYDFKDFIKENKGKFSKIKQKLIKEKKKEEIKDKDEEN